MKIWMTPILFLLLLAPAGACDESSVGGRIMKTKCAACHKINGKGGKVGPELTAVGTRRDEAYLVTKLKSPDATNADTVMPSFADEFSPAEFTSLVDCLKSL